MEIRPHHEDSLEITFSGDEFQIIISAAQQRCARYALLGVEPRGTDQIIASQSFDPTQNKVVKINTYRLPHIIGLLEEFIVMTPLDTSEDIEMRETALALVHNAQSFES